MPNFFDQFDAPAAESAGGGNFFDRFDAAPAQPRFDPVKDAAPASLVASRFGDMAQPSQPMNVHPAYLEGRAAVRQALQSSPSSYDRFKAISEAQGGPGADSLVHTINDAMDTIRKGFSEAHDPDAVVLGVLPKAPLTIAKGVGSLVAAPFNTIVEGGAGLASKATGGLLQPEDFTKALSAIAPGRAAVSGLPAKLSAADRTAAEIRAGAGPAAPAPRTEDLSAAAEAAYDSPEVKGLVVKPDAISGWSQQMRAKLNAEGFDEIGAPKTFARLSRLDEMPEGSFVTGDNLNSLRKSLRKAAQSPDGEERAAASMAINHLDDFIPTIGKDSVVAGSPAATAAKLEEARGNYAALKRSEDVTKRADNAELDAAAANSGQNLENRLRQQIKTILKTDRLKQGYSANELELMNSIVRGTAPANIVRGIGNLLGGGLGIGAVLSGAAGVAAAGPAGVVAPAFGFALKTLGTWMGKGQIAKLDEMIRARSPLGRSVGASVRDWSEAAQSYQAQPSIRAFVALNLATRNLANNLKGARIAVSPDDILRSLQGPVPTGAQQEQPKPERVVDQQP